GGYSRFGLWRQMFAALLIFIAVKTLDNLFNDFARQDPQNWPAKYAASAIGFTVAFFIFWLSARPALFARRLGQGSQ
ncbi:MAG: LPS export ABC transporter permease LptF, partial [Paracoccaceae bacterium]